jgi:hypothetical protein
MIKNAKYLPYSPDSSENPCEPGFGSQDYFTMLLFLLEFSELRLQRIAGPMPPEKPNFAAPKSIN